MFPNTRLRRLRQHPQLRALVQEIQLNKSDLVYPIFVRHGTQQKVPVASMPGMHQFSLDTLADEIQEVVNLGIPAVILFGIPEHKDEMGSDANSHNGIIAQAIQVIKEIAPDLLVIADTCFCEYTSHGHCGEISDELNVVVDNDKTLAGLAQQSLVQARAGADVIAPSGMMDGMVAIIRETLDKHGFTNTPIMSYSVKYNSSFYGPFRDAAEGAPQFGTRESYQMNFANRDECLREAELDIVEGADILMVKPAGAYLDVIHKIKQAYSSIPLAAYQVSGEYAMIKAAGRNGWINETQVMLESLIAIKRAGANFIITYFSKEAAQFLNEQN